LYREYCLATQKINKHYKHIVIGGGIVGAGILRDLALHKEDCLLIEKFDFASQTSGGSSKMLHGGIRYLENFDFFLVFEALREKKIWLKLASHISKERTFFLPVFKDSKWPLSLMRVGLFIYDLLSLFKNRPYQVYSKQKTLDSLIGLKSKGLTGAGVYSDGVIDDSKLVFDLIFDSIFHGAHAVNYHQLTQVKKNSDGVGFNLTVKNTLNNSIFNIECENLIFALGPFTDQVMHNLSIPWKNIILPSKGSHLWIKKDSLKITESLVIQTKDKRVIFVIPQRNSILIGTTEIKMDPEDKLENLVPSAEEIQYLLDSVNEYFPSANLCSNSIISSYTAVRPLVRSGISASKTSRKHKIFLPEKNMFVIAGGKYTTFRVMAKDICKKIIASYNSKLSQQDFSKKSLLHDIHTQKIDIGMLEKIIQEEQVHNMEDLIKRRLSLYSMSQYEDPETLKSLLDKVKIS
jgi:glycerol-3-phosphate dehydrogenase